MGHLEDPMIGPHGAHAGPTGSLTLEEAQHAIEALPVEHLIRRYGLPDDDLVSRNAVLRHLTDMAPVTTLVRELLQRLESHGNEDMPCKLDARDREVIKRAKTFLKE
jgi:hypothetical protein